MIFAPRGDSEKDRDSFSWLLCTTRQQHEAERLMLVQIVAGEALEDMAKALEGLGEETKVGWLLFVWEKVL